MAVAERGITHGMRYQARALAALAAESDRPCWIAGTTALREDNEVPIVFAATVVVRQLFRHNAPSFLLHCQFTSFWVAQRQSRSGALL